MILLVAFSNAVVLQASRGRIFSDPSALPHNYVGVVLGTSPFVRGGGWNPFFVNRIQAAVTLYQAGKVNLILVSGDNQYRTYNEPAQMRKLLVENGVPESRIIVDAAGYRTLDSIVRAGTVFGWHKFTVISQEFHNHRALFVADHSGLNVVAFNAEDVGGYTGLRQTLREQLARALAVLDVYLLGTEPRELDAVEPTL